MIGGAYLVAFIGADKLATWFEIAPGISLWYAPPALVLALLLVLGLRWLPLAFAGSLLSAWFVYPMPAAWATVAMAANTTLGYAAVAALLRSQLGRPPRLDTMPRALAFSVVLLVAAAPVAIIGTGILEVMRLTDPHAFGRAVFRWWLGDTAGILSILPVLLINVAPRLEPGGITRHAKRTPGETAEIVVQAAALLATLALIYAWPPLRDHYVPYLGFVPLTWIVLRHGLPGAAWAIFVINVGSTFVLKAAAAPESVFVSYLLFQFATAAMGLGLGAMVTRRQHAEAEKARLLEIVEATPDFIATAEPGGRVLYRNTALRQLGAPELTHPCTVHDLLPGWAATALLQEAIPVALAHGRWSGESALLDAEGREVCVSQVVVRHAGAADEDDAVFIVARDLTQQKRAEAQRLEAERKMLLAQKLESLGVLAGGIAHDFNNLLTTVLGNAGLARNHLPAGSDGAQNIDHIERAALRAAELCQQMLAYSGKSRTEPTLIDLAALVNDTAQLLQVSLPKKATLHFDLPRNLPGVRADATQLRQVIMNLVLNAADAIGNRPGQIRVAVGAMRADAAWLEASFITPPPPPGDYVYVEVTDDGHGMSPETKARMFEPFFTTKFTGHGLGLSAVLGIVRAHGGTLRVHSELDQGTRFRVALPAAPGVLPRVTPAAAPERAWRGSGTVLVVDDEETVRVVTARILEAAGFAVELAANGSEAVEVFAHRGPLYRAVVLDMLMPVLDGAQALEEIREMRPDIPVLLMSGYSGYTGDELTSDGSPTAFLSKPFQPSTLVRTLGRLLETPGITRSASV